MRKSDLHASLQKTAMPVPDCGGVFAVVPCVTPHLVDITGCESLFATAAEELAGLAADLKAFPQAEGLQRLLTLREAVDSSVMEGGITGFSSLLMYELDGAVEGGLARKNDAVETLDCANAYTMARKHVDLHGVQGIGIPLIEAMHRVLMAGSPVKTPGRIRTEQNFIGHSFAEARFIPPPPEMVPALLTDLTKFMRWDFDDEMQPSLLMRTAVVHGQFEAIHPFLAGNGRVGRMLVPLMFAADQEVPVYVSSFLQLRQDEYYSALLAAHIQMYWTPWLHLFLECVVAYCRHTRGLIVKYQALRAKWETTQRARSHASIRKVLDGLLASPFVTAPAVAKSLQISFSAAKSALDQLVAYGTLRRCSRKISGSSAYYAHEVVTMLHAGLAEEMRRSTTDLCRH